MEAQHRSSSMKVLVLGFSRTGTQSLADALEILGYQGVYHMREVSKNGHAQFWTAALEAKRKGEGRGPSREEFDGILGNYEALSDLPAAVFYAELLTAYPDAKAILTVRSEDKWYDSMAATLVHSWAQSDRQAGPMKDLGDALQQLWDRDFERNGRACFKAHNEGVLAAAADDKEGGGSDKNERLLIYEVKEGWEPLCKFLGKELPEKSFPRADDWLEYKQLHGSAQS